MKIALNGATTMKADLKTDIAAASAAGFDLIEIWRSKLLSYLESNTVGDLSAEIAAAGLSAWSINSIEHITFRTPEEYDAIKAECRSLAEIASHLACPYIVVVPGKLPANATKGSIAAHTIEVLGELADIAEPFGVSLAFEFLGQTDCSVQTLGDAIDIVNSVDRRSVGLVLDTFHFYAGNSEFSDIDRLDKEKLFVFHINDSENVERSRLTDAHRLYPGEGILPLTEIHEHLRGIGYDRMVSIEIFRPEYWEQDPYYVAESAKLATERTLGIGRFAAGGSW